MNSNLENVMTGTMKKNAEAIFPDVKEFLGDLLRIPSLSGCENDAMAYLYEQFSKLDVTVEKVPLSDALKSDPDYSSPIPDIAYDGRYNLRVTKKGKNRDWKIVFNAHVDVVPPSEGMDAPYSGVIEDGVIYGRGACDNKGPLSVVYMLLALLEKQNVQPECDLVAHLVVEEENGGNGSLVMVRDGETADACIVLEPTESKVLTSIRGAVWFKLEFFGKAGHSGQAGQTQSALLLAKEAVDRLTDYHARLLVESRGIDLFDSYKNPMPITFGKLIAGNWPASAPNKALLEGVLGFLPNKTKEQICTEMEESILKSPMLNKDNFKLMFTYRHDCSVVDPDSQLPKNLLKSNLNCSVDSKIDAMTASCDAWFYNNILKIPTVVYGPGTLKAAHSKEEHIKLNQIKDASIALYDFVTNFKR